MLAEELHFGRAAQRLAISQPPLSVSLRQLEDGLGVRLFERSSRQVRLTPAGRDFLVSARRLLEDGVDALGRAQRIASGRLGRLKLGFVASMLYRGLPGWLHALHERSPDLDVSLHELNSGEQIEALLAGRLDAGFVHAPQLPTGLDGIEVFAEPYVCCLPVGHAQAQRRRISLEVLKGETLIVFARELAPADYEQILGLCRSAGMEPAQRHEVRHWLTVVALVAAGMGVALAPRSLAGAGMAGVCFLPLAQVSAASVARLAWLADDPPPALTVLRQIVEQGR